MTSLNEKAYLARILSLSGQCEAPIAKEFEDRAINRLADIAKIKKKEPTQAEKVFTLQGLREGAALFPPTEQQTLYSLE